MPAPVDPTVVPSPAKMVSFACVVVMAVQLWGLTLVVMTLLVAPSIDAVPDAIDAPLNSDIPIAMSRALPEKVIAMA